MVVSTVGVLRECADLAAGVTANGVAGASSKVMAPSMTVTTAPRDPDWPAISPPSAAAGQACPIERSGWMIRHVLGFGLPCFGSPFSARQRKKDATEEYL